VGLKRVDFVVEEVLVETKAKTEPGFSSSHKSATNFTN
jgi:hypothetical protein